MGRVALITGASRGIGRSIAEELASTGFRVAVNYAHSKEAAEEVVASIADGGGEAVAVGGDVSREDDVAGVFERIEESLGPVEVLVNNAGIVRDGLLLRMTPDMWDEVLAVNLRAVYLCTKAALRSMVRTRWGRVISVTSVSGLGGNPGQANYAAAKAGVVGFTKSVAKEVGSRGITVNAVAPGFVETDMTADIDEVTREGVIPMISVGRFGRPEEIASAVGYLASDAASYVNGQVLVVDGGLAI